MACTQVTEILLNLKASTLSISQPNNEKGHHVDFPLTLSVDKKQEERCVDFATGLPVSRHRHCRVARVCCGPACVSDSRPRSALLLGHGRSHWYATFTLSVASP